MNDHVLAEGCNLEHMARARFQFSVRTMAAVVALLALIFLWAKYTIPCMVLLAGPLAGALLAKNDFMRVIAGGVIGGSVYYSCLVIGAYARAYFYLGQRDGDLLGPYLSLLLFTSVGAFIGFVTGACVWVIRANFAGGGKPVGTDGHGGDERGRS
jgi:hypothetical protein